MRKSIKVECEYEYKTGESNVFSIKGLRSIKNDVYHLFLTDEEIEKKFSYLVQESSLKRCGSCRTLFSVYTTYKKAFCSIFFGLLDNTINKYTSLNNSEDSKKYKDMNKLLINIQTGTRNEFIFGCPYSTITRMCVNVIEKNDYRKSSMRKKYFDSFEELYKEFVRLKKIQKKNLVIE